MHCILLADVHIIIIIIFTEEKRNERNVSKIHKIGISFGKTISRKSVIKGFSFRKRGHIMRA